ncbi:putative monooxygenase [Streptomyces sp. Amel2xB2]|uniref:Cupin n=1 Tax=Streptomyces nanshensis TaxID=518642 RepID=A0A1E7LC67_9ACTN|nr:MULTISPECIES: cupin domain-containing protein [Streptomyces]OEV13701.1 cupin [Streptomyces nanshensis]RAJ61644.1 putative monooxygenase [Streptomyces sp. Amel2xB2]
MADAPIQKVALGEVAVNRRRGGEMRVLLSPKTVGCGTGFFGELTLAPGEFVSEHYHPYSEEYLFVIDGALTVLLDGTREVELAAGEGLVVPIGVRHRVTHSGTVPTRAVFQLAPLAPRPDLGHVDTEATPNAAEPVVEVGEAQ